MAVPKLPAIAGLVSVLSVIVLYLAVFVFNSQNKLKFNHIQARLHPHTTVDILETIVADEIKSLEANPLHLKVWKPSLKLILFSSWRSGSSNFGQALASYPGTLLYPEPLINHGPRVFRNESNGKKFALDILEHVITCNFTYVQSKPEKSGLTVEHIFWNPNGERDAHGGLRMDTEYRKLFGRGPLAKEHLKVANLDAACNLFPITVLKIVRATLDLFLYSLSEILRELMSQIRIVVLVRDPRSVMESRRKFGWFDIPDYSSSKFLCESYVRNYHSARTLMASNPDSVAVVRFEDWMADPANVTFGLFDHFGLLARPPPAGWTPGAEARASAAPGKVMQKLMDIGEGKHRPRRREKWTRIKSDQGGGQAGKAGSLGFQDVLDIQAQCAEAMRLWGYKKVVTEAELSVEDADIAIDTFVQMPWTMMA